MKLMKPEVFRQIKEQYDNFYKGLLRNGKLPFGSTGDGFWGSVVADEVYEAFKKINLHKHKTFVDLGSGDGKAVLIASLFCKRAVGIEMDNDLFNTSLEMQEKLNIPNAIFFNNNFNEFFQIMVKVSLFKTKSILPFIQQFVWQEYVFRFFRPTESQYIMIFIQKITHKCCS